MVRGYPLTYFLFMLTISNLKQFKDTLNSMLFEVDSLLKTRERQLMFKNADDVTDAKISRLHCPQDYYSFRLFTDFIELNKDKKGFYIYCENFIPVDNPDLMAYRNGYTSQYRIPVEFTFEQVENVFVQFCLALIHKFSKELDDDKLFYIY